MPPPHAQAAASLNHQSLQYVDSVGKEKIHNHISFSSLWNFLPPVIEDWILSIHICLELIRLYDWRFAFHVPFHIKEGTSCRRRRVYLYVRVLLSGRTCPRRNGRTPAA